MAEKVEDGSIWPPAVLLGKGFYLGERCTSTLMPEIEKGRGMVRENPSFSYPNITMEMESDDEDYVAGLTRQMAHSFLLKDNTSSFWDSRVLATSPELTLCDAGIWSASRTGSPNGGSKVSPRLSTFLEQRKEDAMDLLYATAGEVLRKKRNEQRAHERHQLNPLVNTKSSAIAGSYNNHVLARQQIQAAQFYKLKQQQLIKQQVSSAWGRQNRAAAAISNRPHRSSTSAWPPKPQPQPQPSSGMRAIFLNGPGARRESTGTGVFLPRSTGSPPAKNPACSTVLLPARVIQALNLSLSDTGVKSCSPVHISRDHAYARGRPGHNEQKRNVNQLPSPTISGHEMRLPKEWTY